MKTGTSFILNLAGALLIVIASATIAAAQAQSDTCVGLNATIGGTCTPLTNTISANNANTAVGANALVDNTTGGDNAGFGFKALQQNTTGTDNTAVGAFAMGQSGGPAGDSNTAVGFLSLVGNDGGSGNVALGDEVLTRNSSGNANVAIGLRAMTLNGSGSSNIAIGQFAGFNITGDNNIDIFDQGVSDESNTIRIGTQGTQTTTFLAGVFGNTGLKKACQVVVDSNGQLGCIGSSARYKHDIRDMGDTSDRLMKLRPVTFRYKADASGTPQYGLIAEEVEKVYPELVVDNKDGKPETVEYQMLPAMLLNEVQKQSRQLARKDAQIAAMQRQIEALQKKDREIDTMAERLDALEQQARASQPERVAATH